MSRVSRGSFETYSMSVRVGQLPGNGPFSVYVAPRMVYKYNIMQLRQGCLY